MERILILAVVLAVALARPETYKEKEDFQYSRSSSDDGSKSGFYGAQRGNMGGNYERAHNMDSLAQHQMSGLVHQVDGELGDGAKTRTGSVYSAASSRGVYGSGNYDLSNLAGRNFQEGEAHGDSQLRSSSLSSSAHNSAAYTNSRSHSSRIGGYQAAGHTSHSWQSGDLQTADKSGNSDLYDNLQAAGKSQSSSLYDYGQQTGQNSGYNAYGANDANSYSGRHGSDVGTRLISTVPVRIVVRPGTRVAIPIGTQTYGFTQGSSTYDADQRSSSYDANHKSSTYDANQRSYDQTSVIGEAEALSDANRHILYTPKNDAKHYESSYKYRKEWEKHDTIPATVTLPTAIDNSFPTDNELYEERQGRASNHQYSDSKKTESSNAYSGYNANVKSASSQSKYQSDLERHRLSSASNLNAYTQGGYNANVDSNGDLNSEVEDINSKPKNYHSSYSYHKSWERQGDPYVIKPASSGYYDDQSSQQLSAGTKNAFNSGSQHQSYANCDEVCGHVRVARSYDAQKYEGQEQLGQQAQNLEDFGQQSQNMEGFGQRSQNLEDFGQQSQNMESFGQRSQNLEDFGQQSQNLEDFGQQSQNLEDFGQQSQNLEDFGQQSQNLEDLGQQNQNLENFGPQSQNLDNYSQQSQSQLNNLEDLGQRPQSTWEKYEDIGQQVQNKQFQNVAQETRSNWEQTEDLGQQSQHNPAMKIQDIWNKLETGSQNVEQESQNKWNFDQANVEEQHVQEHENQDVEDTFVPVQDKFQEQEQSAFDQPDSYSQISQNENDDTLKNPVNAIWDKLDLEKTQSNNNLYTQTQRQSSSGRNFQVTQNAIKQMNDSLSKFDTVQGESHVTQTDKQPTSEEDAQIVQSNSEHPKFNFDSNSHHLHPYFGSGYMRENSNNRQLQVNEIQEIQTWNIDTTSQTQNDWHKLVLTNDSFSHHPPLLNLWNKLDNIQKQLESNSNKSLDQNIAPSEKYTSPENSGPFRQELTHTDRVNTTYSDQHIIPALPHLSINKNENNLTHIQLVERNDQIRSQDIGRGDIESEDLSIPAEMDVKEPTPWPYSDKNRTLPVGNTGLNYINKQATLDQQNVESRNSSQVSNLPTFLTNSTNIEQAHSEVSLPNNEQKLEVLGKDTFDQENVDVSVQKTLGDSLVKQENNFYEQGNLGQNNEHQNIMQDFGYQHKNYQVALSKDKDSQQQNNIPDIGQQDENLEQQSIQDFGQQNDNLEQVNIEDFGQQSLHDFGQQNIQDFGQQSIHDFGQQNDNLEQVNIEDFGQQSLHDFGQQNIQDFGQQSTHDFGQQNKQDFGQQNIQDFGQQSIHDFEQQNIQNFGQQSVQEFGQQNAQDVRYHNENLAQQNIQDFEQQNIQEFRNGNLEKQKYEQQSSAKQHHSDMQQQNFGQQRENYDQQNLQNVEQDNVEKFNQQENHKLEQVSFEKFEPVDNLGEGLHTNWKPRPEKIEEKLDIIQNNLHSTAPKNTEIEIPQEPVTEKPGFWKSVGSKFANAKDKVVSWFHS